MACLEAFSGPPYKAVTFVGKHLLVEWKKMSTSLAAPMFEDNRLLNFVKQNNDSVLKRLPLGEWAKSGCAAHGIRRNGSNQDGFLCLCTHKQAFEGVETLGVEML